MDEDLRGCTRVSAILHWYENKYSPFPEAFQKARNRKAEVGSAVHQAIDVWHKGSESLLTDEEHKYFESFRKWERATKAKCVQSEKRYFDSNLKITGKIDGLYQFPYSQDLVLVDYKTAATASKLWPIQGHLYYHLLTTNQVNISNRFLFVQLQGSGEEAKIHFFKRDQVTMDNALAIVSQYFTSSEVQP